MHTLPNHHISAQQPNHTMNNAQSESKNKTARSDGHTLNHSMMQNLLSNKFVVVYPKR